MGGEGKQVSINVLSYYEKQPRLVGLPSAVTYSVDFMQFKNLKHLE
jgi:hypothetical protein